MAPELQSELKAALEVIVQSRTYVEHENWPEVLEMVISRINSVVGAWNNRDTMLKADVVCSHLRSYFLEVPPFSVLRLAEVISSPEKEGYSLESEAGVAKYVNALYKIVLVSSSVDDFPAPTFGYRQEEEEVIPIVRIPWLKRSAEGESERKRVKRDGDGKEGDKDEKEGDKDEKEEDKDEKEDEKEDEDEDKDEQDEEDDKEDDKEDENKEDKEDENKEDKEDENKEDEEEDKEDENKQHKEHNANENNSDDKENQIDPSLDDETDKDEES